MPYLQQLRGRDLVHAVGPAVARPQVQLLPVLVDHAARELLRMLCQTPLEFTPGLPRRRQGGHLRRRLHRLPHLQLCLAERAKVRGRPAEGLRRVVDEDILGGNSIDFARLVETSQSHLVPFSTLFSGLFQSLFQIAYCNSTQSMHMFLANGLSGFFQSLFDAIESPPRCGNVASRWEMKLANIPQSSMSRAQMVRRPSNSE